MSPTDQRHLFDDIATELRRLAELGEIPPPTAAGYTVHVLGQRWTVDVGSWPLDVAAQVEDEGLLVTWARAAVARKAMKLTLAEGPDGVEVTLQPPGGLARGCIRRSGTCGLLVLLRALREACTPVQQPAAMNRVGGYSRQQ